MTDCHSLLGLCSRKILAQDRTASGPPLLAARRRYLDGKQSISHALPRISQSSRLFTFPLICPFGAGTKQSCHSMSSSVVCPTVCTSNRRNMCATVKCSVAYARLIPMQLREPRLKDCICRSRFLYVSSSQSQRSGSNLNGSGKVEGSVFWR